LLGAAMQKPDMRVDALHHFAVEFKHKAQHPVRRGMLRPEVDCEVALRAFGHHATRAIFAALAATRELNLSHTTTKRSWRPSPIRSTPSWALTLKVTC